MSKVNFKVNYPFKTPSHNAMQQWDWQIL